MAETMARWREPVLAGLVNLALCGLLVWGLRDPRQTALRVEAAPTRTPAPSATPVRMQVHVSGAVRRPGLVRLPEGARAAEALAAAGGMTERALPAVINLAAPLTDGMQLHVPAEGEVAPPIQAPVPAGGASGAAALAADPASAAAPAGGPIDINRATAAELEALPGIGPALAARIVAHREAEGRFAKLEDLLEVSGIGEKTLARFADRLVLR